MNDAALVFVLCAPRSGSTLLRLVLDAHPDIACPPETNLAMVGARLEEHVARTYQADGDSDATVAIRLSRQIADKTLGEYARIYGKQRWAEKSLTSVEHVDAPQRCFPDARFVCLVRECRDTIVSMLEASPYGLSALGLPPYAERHPTNTVAACAEMWLDRVSAMLRFEANQPSSCLSVRYEDMVRYPAETMSGLCRFLDLERSEDLLSAERLLDRSRQAGYGGDAKVWYRTPFDSSSIGRGLRVPPELIPQSVGERIDGLHRDLDYPLLNEFRAVEDVLVPEPMQELEALLTDRLPGRLRAIADQQTDPPIDSILRLVIAHAQDPWMIDFRSGTVERGNIGVFACTVLTDAETLLGMLKGTCNPGTAMREGRIRVVVENPANDRRVAARTGAWHREALIRLLAPMPPLSL